MLTATSLIALLPVTAGCASTTYDETLATSATTAVATTTTVPTGAAAELLPRLRDEAASLSGVMIDEGDDRAVADTDRGSCGTRRKQEVGSARPDLVDSFDDNVAARPEGRAVQAGGRRRQGIAATSTALVEPRVPERPS